MHDAYITNLINTLMDSNGTDSTHPTCWGDNIHTRLEYVRPMG